MWIRVLALIFFLGCAWINVAPQTEPKPKPRRFTGGLVTDLPFEPADKDFKFQIWLDTRGRTPEDTIQKVRVRIYENPNLTFTPQTFDLDGNKPETIHVVRKPGSASLVEVIARPDGGLNGIDQTINFGFKASLKAEIPPIINPGDKRAFTLKLIDEQGKNVTLRAPAFLRLIASNAQLTSNGNSSNQKLDIPLQTGANATSLIEVVPANLKLGGTGSVQAELHASEQYVLSSADPYSFTIPVAGWVQLLLAILGGLLNAAYSILRRIADAQKEDWKDIAVKAGFGVIGGILAVLFIDKFSIIGITLDRASVAGYVSLGFILSYIGIDAFFSKVRPSTNQNESPQPPQAKPGGNQRVTQGVGQGLGAGSSGSGNGGHSSTVLEEVPAGIPDGHR